MSSASRSTEQFLGIDVGGTKIQGAYLQQETVLLTRKIATPADYAAFLVVLVGVVEEAALTMGQASHVGIGIPGTVSGRHTTWVPNLPFLNGKDLVGDLRARLDASIVLANDAQLALLGEMWRGAAQQKRHVVLFSVGTGVGGAIMMGGKIVRGVHGSAGAFGWLNLDWHEAPHLEHGYTERYGAGNALDAYARQLDPPMTSYDLIAKAREHDPACRAIIQHFGRVLGSAFASIASVLDPDLLIFSGGLADAFDLFAPTLNACMRELGSPSVRETPIVVAQLGTHAAAYGALRAAMLQESIWI